MNLREALLTETSRSKPMEMDDALKFIQKNCKDALKAWKRGGHGDYIFRGLWSPGTSQALEVQGNIEPPRKSRNTSNYYTLLLDNLPSWRQYPRRGRSIICSSGYEKADAYGEVFYVFPVDGAKIGVCSDRDIFTSFMKVTKPYAMNVFNATLQELVNSGTGTISETEWDNSWTRMSNKMKLFDKEYVESGGGHIKVSTSEWGYNQQIADTIMNMYKKSKTMKETMDKLLDPSRNGFKLMKSGQKLPKDKEVWIEEKCILIRQDNNWEDEIKSL